MYDTENPVPRDDGRQNRRSATFRNIAVGIGSLGVGAGGAIGGLGIGTLAAQTATGAPGFGSNVKKALIAHRRAADAARHTAEQWRPAYMGKAIKAKGKGILHSAAIKAGKLMSWKHRLNLQSRIRALEFATLDYTRKYITDNPALARPGEPGYDPNVQRVVKAAFLRKNPLSEEEQARRAKERGRPIVSTTEVGGQLVGGHPGTEAGKKIRKPGQQTKPYSGLKSEISAQQRGLTARPKPIPVEELPAGENLPKQKGRIPKRGAGFEPSEKDVPNLWDPEKATTPEGDINYTYRNRFPPNQRPALTKEEVRRNALKWRDPMAYHEARVKGEFTPNLIIDRSKTDISGKARPSTGLPNRYLPPSQEVTERAMAQSFRDKLAVQLRTIHRQTIKPLQGMRRKALGLKPVKPMPEGTMARLRAGTLKTKGKLYPAELAHIKPTIRIMDKEISPQVLHGIHQGQKKAVEDIQAHHVGIANKIKQGVQDRIESNLTNAQLKESGNLMGDARRAVHTRYGEIKESAARISHEAFNADRVSIEGPFARIPKGMKNLPQAQLDDYEVKALAEHAGMSAGEIRKQHQAFVHHTRLGTTSAGEDAIRKSMGSKIFGRFGMPEEPVQPAASSLLRHLNKRTAIGAGVAAGVGIGAYAINKWRKRKKEEFRFEAKGMIPYSRAKRLIKEVKARTLRQAAKQGRLKSEAIMQPKDVLSAKLAELDAHIKTYKEGQATMSGLHQNLVKNVDTVTGLKYKVDKNQLDLSKAAGYSEGTSAMEKVLDLQKQATRQKVSSLKSRSKRIAIASGVAGLGVGAGTGYALRRNGNKETQFAVPGAFKRLQGKLKLGTEAKKELFIGGALTGGITAADAATGAIFPKHGQTRKQAAWEGTKQGAVYGAVLSGVEPAIRIPLTRRYAMESKMKEIQFQKWATLRFEDPDIPSPWNKKKRLTVAQDRYRKVIREREIQRKESNIGKSALAGAAVGGLLHHKVGLKLTTGLAAGAGAGVAAQTAAMIHGRDTKDPYGEESISAKRVERLPYQAGGVAAAGLIGHQLYKGAKRAHLFNINGRLIRFQYNPNKEEVPYYEKEAKRWIEHPKGRVENAKKWIGRAGRIHEDLRLPKDEHGQVIDERGRPRKAEWQKPWFKHTVYGGAAVAGLVGLRMAGKRIGRTAYAAKELMHKGARVEELSQSKQMALNLTSGNWLRAIKEKTASKMPVINKGFQGLGKLREEFGKTRDEIFKKTNKAIVGQVGQITGVKPKFNRDKDITGYDLINPAKHRENLQKIAAHEEHLGKEMERMRKLRVTSEKTQKARSVLDEMTKLPELSALLDHVIQFDKQSEEEGYVKVKPHYRKERRQKYPFEEKKNREAALIGGIVASSGLAAGGGILWQSHRQKMADKVAQDVSESWKEILAARKAASGGGHIPHFHLPTP